MGKNRIMASIKHDFIVSAISRKMRLYGFTIVYLDGRNKDISLRNFYIPPQIRRHRPDLIGFRGQEIFCIGEAKTNSDLVSERTHQQLIDFYEIVCKSPDNKLLIGIPESGKRELFSLLSLLGIPRTNQIEILLIPEVLFPNEEGL